MKIGHNVHAIMARRKGKMAYYDGKALKENFYRYHTNKQGAISLMAQWDVGWKMAELEDKNPGKYKLLLNGGKNENKR